jgi:hypothetical protein
MPMSTVLPALTAVVVGMDSVVPDVVEVAWPTGPRSAGPEPLGGGDVVVGLGDGLGEGDVVVGLGDGLGEGDVVVGLGDGLGDAEPLIVKESVKVPPDARTNRAASWSAETSTFRKPQVAFELLPCQVAKYGACATVGSSEFMFLPPEPTVATTVPLPRV